MTKALAAILVVDDDEHIRRSLRALLSARQYDVRLAASGAEGVSLAADARPDLVILDMNMPGMDGPEVCEVLRAWYTGPILVLSALEGERDKIVALDAGADDYVTKPCAPGELLARIRAHLRRTADAGAPPAVFTAGDLTLDPVHRLVTRDGVALSITPIEYELLGLLVRNADCVVTYRMILQQVWHEEFYGDTKAVSVHISNLRKKLEMTPDSRPTIQNEHGVGFRLVTK